LINQPDQTGLGWDFAGTVIASVSGVSLAVGTRVAGLVDGFDREFGTYAERHIAPATHAADVRPTVSPSASASGRRCPAPAS
jgi:NADPH:quinone reductase-like Zn-dependent oxidoreductase